MKRETQVILIDEDDNPTGEMEKMEAHRKALLHRAFSVFIFNSKGELLLQRRALHKYHSGGLWTNTCCSHPAPGEETIEAAGRRLMEEMGMTTPLHYLTKFTYKAHFCNELTEYETDHIYTGFTDQLPCINREEVAEFRYDLPENIREDIHRNPEKYTTWFQLLFRDFYHEITTQKTTGLIKTD